MSKPALGATLGAVLVALSFLAASVSDAEGRHHYFEIMLPGAILGVMVGFATQRFGTARERAS